MWQKIVSDLIKAFRDTGDEPSNKQILEELEKVEKELEAHERRSSYRYGVTVGISIIGLGFGASLTQPRPDWLVWLLIFGGILIIIASSVEYNRAIDRKTANVGLITILIGIVVSAVQLYSRDMSSVVFLIGFLILLIGFLISIKATKSIKRN